MRLADSQGASFARAAVELGDGLLRLVRVSHFYKRTASGPPRIAVNHQPDAFDPAVRSEQRTDSVFGDSDIQVTNEYILQLFSSLRCADTLQRLTPRF